MQSVPPCGSGWGRSLIDGRFWGFAATRYRKVVLTASKLHSIQTREEPMALTSTLAGKNLGMVLLGIWLIHTGLLPLLSVRVSSTITTVLAVLAVAAGLLILLRR